MYTLSVLWNLRTLSLPKSPGIVSPPGFYASPASQMLHVNGVIWNNGGRAHRASLLMPSMLLCPISLKQKFKYNIKNLKMVTTEH